MRNDLTDITLIIDRSGSMDSIQSDAQGGINTFIEEQRKLPGEARLTIVEFDDKYDVVYDGVDIKGEINYKLVPRGGTALLDAVGKTINTVGERLSKMDEKDRPGLVVILIVTDGEENSSREFSREQIKNMIDHQTNVYKWQFTYIGSDISTFQEAGSIGLGAIGQSVALVGNNKMWKAYQNTSSKVARMRGQSMSLQDVDNSYTEDEIKSMT